MEKTINLLLSERANATSLETRTLLDKQYVDACDEYSLILKEIEHLQDKEQAEINLAARYKRVKALIDGKQVTPEMINKDILDVFLYRIIVVDRNDIVITINVTKTIPLEELRKIRKEIAERKPLYEKTIKMRDPKKMARLHYKVVLV